jgi:hypothetical protein
MNQCISVSRPPWLSVLRSVGAPLRAPWVRLRACRRDVWRRSNWELSKVGRQNLVSQSGIQNGKTGSSREN